MEVGSDEQLDFLREWQHKVWSAGYLGMAWPKEYGGQGVDAIYQKLSSTRRCAAPAVPICFNVIGLGWAGPLINDIGTEEEKARYLKGILSAEDIWCQGFSEPDHGSDLGNARTRAERDGDSYVSQRQQDLDHPGQLREVHDPAGAHQPRSGAQVRRPVLFPAPMTVDGIETRPIRKLTGEYGFTETFFTDARIPADCLMGEEGEGWKIAMKTLQYERGAEAGAAGGLAFVRIVIDDLVGQLRDVSARRRPVLEDPVLRDELVQPDHGGKGDRPR
jgi:alkylation response protein AidB-like acyl-CoA dehydrogenase